MYSARSSSRTRPSTGGGGIRTTSSLLATLSANVLGKTPDSKGPTRVGDSNRPNSARCTAADTQRSSVLPTRKQATTVAPRSVLPAAPRTEAPRTEAPRSNDLFREPSRDRMQVRPPTVAVKESTQLFRRASTVVASTNVSTSPTPTTTMPPTNVSPPSVVAPTVVNTTTKPETVTKPEARTSLVIVDSTKSQPPAPKPNVVEKVPPQPQPTCAVSTEAVMERRHTGKWVHEFPTMGYFACVGCTTPVAGSTSKVPSVKGYATFSSYFEPSVELGVVVPQMGVGDSFVGITCIKCKSFLGRLCTDDVDDRMSEDLSQFNSKALKYVASPVPGGFGGPAGMDDRVTRRRRNKGPLADETTSDTDSDDADDDLWSSMRNRPTR